MSDPFIINGFKTEGQCREDSFYIRFNDEDVEELAKYAFDMGYILEPEVMASDPEHPVRFKIIARNNPAVYGWISKVMEKAGDHWQESILYDFYRHGSFRNKYPITFNGQSQNMRGVIKETPKKMFGRMYISEPSLASLTWNRNVIHWTSFFHGCGVLNFSISDTRFR